METLKLTRRQEQYLHEIVRLQIENGGSPIHYTDLAQQLTISKSTAYHVLRTLEKKGYVRSSYELPEVRIGRTSVLYETTCLGESFFRNYA